MFRIRLHGRGGQGIKTASRVLGTAFFLEGFEVQDAPRYGAERRGAPMFAYVRASRSVIHERGVIDHPGLVLVADDTLVDLPAAGVVSGISADTFVLIHTAEAADVWANRIRVGHVLTTMGREPTDAQFGAIRGAGAAARLVGVVSRASLERAVRIEVEGFGLVALRESTRHALEAFDEMEAHRGFARPQHAVRVEGYRPPDWVDVPFENVHRSAPTIHAGGTSVLSKTGLWRTMRPIVAREHCHRCTWICSTLCPDNAILRDEGGYPSIDLEHCKGCLICVAQCPHYAIAAVPERDALHAASLEPAS